MPASSWITPPQAIAYPHQSKPVLVFAQPALTAESRNVVSAKAASPRGAGSAIPVAAGAAAGATADSSVVLTCILLGRLVSLRKLGGAGTTRGNLHGTDHTEHT